MVYFLYFLFCHVLGWFMTGYIVVRLLNKTDIRFQGSGNIGALNSGRSAGRKGFILTFAGDALKGIIAVLLAAVVLELPKWGILLGLTLVVSGHIWPFPFGFRGGKGVSTFIGGVLIYDPMSVAFMAGVAAVFCIWRKDFTIAGLVGIFWWPLYGVMTGGNTWLELLIEVVLVTMILWAHRRNIGEFYLNNLKKQVK